jgi:uncharacterized protein
MHFALICTDRPDSLQLRMATRPQHLAYVDGLVAKVVHGGAMLDAAGQPCGSLFILEAADRGEVERFAAEDPYARAGLFESTVIRPLRTVFKDGARSA